MSNNNDKYLQYDDSINMFKTFFDSINKEFKNMGHANLIIAGKSGVGKSTLINAAFGFNEATTGIGKPITDENGVKWYEKEGVPIRIFDTIGFELNEEKRNQAIKQIRDEYQKAQKLNDPDKYIHAMWYCISAPSDRFELEEEDYINNIAKDIPVILVITKSLRKKHAERLIKAIEDSYPNLNVKVKIPVLAQDEDPDDCDEGEKPKKAFGVDTLVEETAKLLPEAAQKAWCSAQKASIELKVKRAQALIVATAAASFGEGYIPLPFSDALALIPTELGMLAGITAIFGINVSENILKTFISSIGGVSAATFAGRAIVSNLLKFIPGVGTVLGGTISGTTASLLTTALGEAYVVLMKMILNGEIKEKDLASEKVKAKFKQIYLDTVKKNKS